MPETALPPMPRRPAPLSDREWLAQQFAQLTTELELVTPSQWAEAKRYLPPSVTSLPGYFRFEVAPYLREIVDCLSVDSPIREVAVMKGAQVCMTTGVLENAIGYYIEHVRSAPVMLATADEDLAKIRIKSYILPMLQHSGLLELVCSSDETNKRKRGATEKLIEWVGGGFLVPFGARSANKLRSISIQVLLRDEIDGWPLTVGKDGDPIALSASRTQAYESSRKIVDLSTPTVKGVSAIEKRFLRGDQRYYHVCCLRCGLSQPIRWKRINPETGEETGIRWEMDGGRLVPGSVRWRCYGCGHDHINEDKTRLLSPENGAEWRPTAEPVSPDVRSYHVSALYSPVGMLSWEGCVRMWLEAWDEERGRVKDVDKLQVFYNNVLGLPFEVKGEQVLFEQAASMRRRAYSFGQVPNDFARVHCGSEVALLTCAVDVHKNQMPVAVWGWCPGPRAVLIDYWRFEGDTEQLSDQNTWGRLRTLIENPAAYVAGDRRYKIELTVIDSGYHTEQVYRFCAEYARGVVPIKGREGLRDKAPIKEFATFRTPLGTRAFHVYVDLFKDRWNAALKQPWSEEGLQPAPFLNLPVDVSDDQMRELTVEVRRPRRERLTGRIIGYEWHRPSGAANELWDLLIYGNAALEMVAWDVCVRHLGLERVDWPTFWRMLGADAHGGGAAEA